VDKDKEITDNWSYDVSCKLTSLPVWDLKNFKCMIFVSHSIPGQKRGEEVNRMEHIIV
jgi:hypothetical protein